MQREKVLIVEDDPTARQMLSRFVTKEGFDVIEAEDAISGLEKLINEKPDIVITDFKMPHGDGIQIIRQAKIAVRHVQTILITAFGELDTAITALREGVLDYIKKPVDLDAMALALGRAKDKLVEFRKAGPFPSILIVEDDEDARVRLKQVMEKDKWLVMTAKDGDEAVGLFKENKFDVVVMDIKLPGKNGLDALKEMRRMSEDFEAVMVTGYGDEDNVIKALKCGAINFVKKPVELEQILLFIQKALMVLNLKRSLKYRGRELEMANNVINSITGAKGK